MNRFALKLKGKLPESAKIWLWLFLEAAIREIAGHIIGDTRVRLLRGKAHPRPRCHAQPQPHPRPPHCQTRLYPRPQPKPQHRWPHYRKHKRDFITSLSSTLNLVSRERHKLPFDVLLVFECLPDLFDWFLSDLFVPVRLIC